MTELSERISGRKFRLFRMAMIGAPVINPLPAGQMTLASLSESLDLAEADIRSMLSAAGMHPAPATMDRKTFNASIERFRFKTSNNSSQNSTQRNEFSHLKPTPSGGRIPSRQPEPIGIPPPPPDYTEAKASVKPAAAAPSAKPRTPFSFMSTFQRKAK